MMGYTSGLRMNVFEGLKNSANTVQYFMKGDAL